MADKNSGKSTIFIKISIQEFLKLLITNQLSDLWNSKWWIQYRTKILKNLQLLWKLI